MKSQPTAQPPKPTLTLPKVKKPKSWSTTLTIVFILLLCTLFQIQLFELNARFGKLCIKAGGTPNIRTGCNFTDAPSPTPMPKTRPAPRRGT